LVIGTAVTNTHLTPLTPQADGWDQIPRWAGGWACTSHLGVLGSIPKREEPAPPRVGSRSPDGWDQIPRWAGGGLAPATLGWAGGGSVRSLAPATLELWVRFSSERNQGKQAHWHPVLKHRVPYGSQCVMGRLSLSQTTPHRLGSSSLVAHILRLSPSSPREQLYSRYYSNKHIHHSNRDCA